LEWSLNCIRERRPCKKNVIVDVKRYHSHIGGNEIKEQMMTLLVLA